MAVIHEHRLSGAASAHGTASGTFAPARLRARSFPGPWLWARWFTGRTVGHVRSGPGFGRILSGHSFGHVCGHVCGRRPSFGCALARLDVMRQPRCIPHHGLSPNTPTALVLSPSTPPYDCAPVARPWSHTPRLTLALPATASGRHRIAPWSSKGPRCEGRYPWGTHDSTAVGRMHDTLRETTREEQYF